MDFQIHQNTLTNNPLLSKGVTLTKINVSTARLCIMSVCKHNIFFTKYYCGENIRIKHTRKQENACWQNILPSHIDDIFSGKKITVFGTSNFVGKTLCSKV